MDPVETLRFIFSHPLNRGRPVTTAARVVGWQLRSRMGGLAPVDFANGAHLLVSRRMYGATGNIYCGLHDFEEMGFLMHFLRAGDVFVDVGANVGAYSMLAASVGARAIAFEPGERFDDLRRNVAYNDYRIDCRRQAVGDRNGVIGFTVGLDAVNHVAEDAEEAGTEVPIVRLDDAVEHATLIKVDTEGFEAAVIAGGHRVFGQASAAIMEIDAADLDGPMRALSALGFRPISYDPFTRQIRPFHRAGNNSILVRVDVEDRLQRAPPFILRDRVI
jgi:FkbM family methyltransferase